MGDKVQNVSQGTGEPIQLADHEAARAPFPQRLERIQEAATVRRRLGADTSVALDADDLETVRVAVGADSVLLLFKADSVRRLLASADANVADDRL